MAQSILTNTVIAAGGRAAGVALGMVILGLTYRLLGTAVFGIYATVLAIGAIIQIFADAGLYLSLTRAITEKSSAENYLLGVTTSLRLVLLLFFFGLGGLVLAVLPVFRSLVAPYWVVALGFIAQSHSQLLMGVFQKYGLIWRATLGDVIGRLAQLAGLIILAGSAHATLLNIASLFSFSAATALILHYLLLPTGVKGSLIFAWPAWKRTLTAASPLAALLILNVIHFRLDLVLLFILRSAAEAGLYGIAYRLLEALLFLPAMFSGLLLPRLTAAWREQNRESLGRYLWQGITFMTWVATFITVSLVYWAPDILAVVSGSPSAPAALPLRLLALSLVPLFIGNVCGFALVACHKQKILLVVALGTTLLNLILNVLFIPRFGIPAAAVTTLTTEVLAAAAVFLAARRLVSVPMARAWPWRLALALAAVAAVYEVISAWPLFAALAAGTIVYVATSVLLRLVSRANVSSLLTTTEA